MSTTITQDMYGKRGRKWGEYVSSPLKSYAYQCKTNPIPTAIATILFLGLATYGIMALVAYCKQGSGIYDTINDFLTKHKMTAITALTATAVTAIICYVAFRTHLRIRQWNQIEDKLPEYGIEYTEPAVLVRGNLGPQKFKSRTELDDRFAPVNSLITAPANLLLLGTGTSWRKYVTHPLETFMYQFYINPIPTFLPISITISAIVVGIMALVHYYGNGVDAYQDLETFVLDNKVDIITGAISSLATMTIAHAAYRTHARIRRCNQELNAQGYFSAYNDDQFFS